MTDSIAIFPPWWRALDDSGAVVPGARIRFYEAGTSTPLPVFSDSGLLTSVGALVTCDSSGCPTSDGVTRTLLYTGTAAYKATLADADDVAIPGTFDEIRAATSSPATSSTATPTYPVTTLTTTYSVVAADRGNVFQCVCTGGSFVVTLPSAVTVGDNWACSFTHDGTANSVTISTVSAQTITYRGNRRTSVTLLNMGEGVVLVSNGAQWIAMATGSDAMADQPGVIAITDRISTPAVSPSAGARYIVTSSPSGAWSSYNAGDIAEADGAGSWLRHIPSEGMLARILDENLFTAWDGSAWVDQTGMRRPTSLTTPVAIFLDQRASGTNGGTPTTGAWTTATLQTTQFNGVSGASLASNTVTLPAGDYRVRFTHQFYGTRKSGLRFKSTTVSANTFYADQVYAVADGATTVLATSTCTGAAVFSLAAPEDFNLQYYCEHSSGNPSLGYAFSLGTVETYATVEITKLSPDIVWP